MNVRTSHLRLALVALGAAVLYNVWYFALRPAPKPAGRAAPETPLLAAPAVPPGPVAPDPLAVPAPPGVDRAAPFTFVRDPFLFGDESRRVVAPPVQHVDVPGPVVRSVLFSAERRLAVVDGRIVGIGETVGAYTVSDIERDAVVFTTLAGARLRISVHETSAKRPVR